MHYVICYVGLEPRGPIFVQVDTVLSSCLFVSGTISTSFCSNTFHNSFHYTVSIIRSKALS